MSSKVEKPDGEPLPLRSAKSGRPPRDIAARLNAHIMRVTFDEFARHGVERTTMDMIASAAEVTKRTLYLRFGSKNELMLRMIDHVFGKYVDPVSSARIASGPVRERLFKAAGKMLDASLEREITIMADLLVWANDHAPQVAVKGREMMNDGPIKLFRAILEQGVSDGEILVEDMAFTTTFIVDALVRTPRFRIVNTAEMSNDSRSKRLYLEQAITLILKGLSPPRR